jgi:hypothetical protein
MKHFIHLVFILMLLFSCRNYSTKDYDEKTGNLILKEWYSRNHQKSAKIYLDKSLRNYIYISWYNDGKLKDSARYLNDTVEGLRKYYEDGPGLMHLENYQHGLMNGPHRAEYNTGVTSFEGYRKNNIMVGEWIFHYLNGNPITYEFYDSSGSMRYFRKYDNTGTVLMTEGSGLIRVRPEKTAIRISEKLTGLIEAAVPPGTVTNLIIEEITGAQRSFGKFTTIIHYPKSAWSWVFNEPGKRILKFTVEIKNLKTGKSESSSFEQVITVNSD